MGRRSRAAVEAERAAKEAEYEAHRARGAREELAWKAVRVRGLKSPEDSALVRAVGEGTVVLDPAEVAREVEAFVLTVRCHEECRDWARSYGYAPYRYPGFDVSRCEVCSKPMECVDGKSHFYHELSGEECRAMNLHHGGNCYHVYYCSYCGDVHSVDSSG